MLPVRHWVRAAQPCFVFNLRTKVTEVDQNGSVNLERVC